MAKRPLLENPQVDPIPDEVSFDELGETAGGPKDAAPVEPIAPAEAPEATREQVHHALASRLEAAEKKVADSVQAQRDAIVAEREARLAVNAARTALNKEFPPITRAELTKQYLAGETAKRAERVAMQRAHGMAPSASALDQLRKNMGGSYGRGGVTSGATRGGATFQGGAITRQGAARLGMVVPGSPAEKAQIAARAERA